MKREENMKFRKKKFLKFYFFQYLKNSYKIQTTFHQYQKLYSTPPWLGARICKVSRKYSNAFLSYSAKTKRDGQTDGQTDGRTGRCNISRPGPSAPRPRAAGDNKISFAPYMRKLWFIYFVVLLISPAWWGVRDQKLWYTWKQNNGPQKLRNNIILLLCLNVTGTASKEKVNKLVYPNPLPQHIT